MLSTFPYFPYPSSTYKLFLINVMMYDGSCYDDDKLTMYAVKPLVQGTPNPNT